MTFVLVETPAGDVHRVEILTVGLNWWIGICRDCGVMVKAKSTSRNARHLGFDGAAILLGRSGIQVWPGHASLELGSPAP